LKNIKDLVSITDTVFDIYF